MSYRTWTADALRSNFTRLTGECWRIVEAQNRVSTLKLVDTLDEQKRLEEILEEKKPPFPPELQNYDYLLFTPFRYEPYDQGSRFRRKNQKEGVFYASENVITAMSEMAFYRFLFFAESPSTPIPNNPAEYTAFSVKYDSSQSIDLTAPPLVQDQTHWLAKDSYEACQHLADEARKAAGDIIRSQSVRCLQNGKNIALISWKAFSSTEPEQRQTWRMTIKPTELVAICEFPDISLSFSVKDFKSDPRIKSLHERS